MTGQASTEKIQKLLPNTRITILADTREIQSSVASHLREWDCDVLEKQLQVGDYIVSDRVGVERKTTGDFLRSVVDQRIFDQLQTLSDSYDRCLLLLEGSPESLFYESGIHPNTVRGVLASIAIDSRIPIIWTPHPKETAAQIYWLAYREQVKGKRELAIRVNKKAPSLKQQQEFLVAGLPGISTRRARQLLQKFRTPEKIFRAREAQLLRLEGFGEKRIRRIKDILRTEYSENENQDK
jgi:Fanconi anemia group M protein